MSKLDELIRELCPNGVEYKKISEISTKISSGGTPNTSKSEYYNGTIPWLRTQEIEFGDILDTGIKITKLGLEKSSAKMIPINCVIVAMYGATVGKVGINKIPLTTNQACCNIEVNKQQALYKYVFHFLCSKYEYIKSLGQGSQTNINAQIVKEIAIPLPPLPVQEEIVCILDNFTELTAKLTAELTARKKQYEYYRESLLTFGDDVPVFPLSEVAQYSTAKIGAAEVNKFTYVGVDNLLQNKQGKTESSYVPTEGRLTKYTTDNILIGNIRPYLKKIWFANTCGGTNGDVLVIQVTADSLLPRYLYILLSSENFFNYNMQNAKGAKMPRGSKDAIMRFPIPVPLLSEQQRIVDILDRFETLCNDISQGLPAEIKARQQQYEYYRDKLLTFKKKET